MIPFFIYMIIKKIRNQSLANFYIQVTKFLSFRYGIIFMGLLIILLALVPLLSRSQSRQLNYKIIQGGDEIGWMRLEKNMTGNRSSLVLVSEIKTRMILLIKVSAKETADFENGKLIHSSQFRKTNGDVKVNKQTRFISDKYEVVEDGEKENLSYRYIGANLLSLYFQEPAGVNVIYCDKHQCFIKVAKTDDGGYKVRFPDGNSNVFYYSGGVCTKIIIEHTFYTASMILKP
ncbi:MAG: DUF6134 family protein [Ferruginibacter sp.]